MISLERLLSQLPALPQRDLELWITNAWVRPDGRRGAYFFQDIDVARVRLILELREDLEINDAGLPVVLLLLDQVYELRRQLKSASQTLG